MKIEKISTNSYRIRKTYKGHTYTIYTSYKPTQKEALQLMAEKMDNVSDNAPKSSFLASAEAYINLIEGSHSPSTIRGYKSILKAISDDFKNLRISDITSDDVQREVDLYAKEHSAKTTSNVKGFICSVLRHYRPHLNISITLPQKRQYEAILPSDDDIKKLLAYLEGSEMELPVLLGILGMRRSEVCALTSDDLTGNEIYIHRAVVNNSDNEWVVKESTKNSTSTRRIFVPDRVRDLLLQNGKAFDGHPHTLNKTLHKVQKKLDMPLFRFHDLRHYYVSMAHSLGVPDIYIMANCGFKTDATMKRVYRQSQKEKEIDMQKFVADYITELKA